MEMEAQMSFQNPTRRAFLQGGLAAFGAAQLMGSTALASIDPNSFSGRVFSASHYGPFEAVVRDGKIVQISPMIELDQRPTEMLAYGVLDRVYDKTRIDYPMVRKSYLAGWKTGETSPELRGKEEYVRVDWDTALKLAAKAIVDTIEKHGNQAILPPLTEAGAMRASCGRTCFRVNSSTCLAAAPTRWATGPAVPAKSRCPM